jgi:hypothetical protein
MRLGTFAGSLVYAAISALVAIPYLMAARPILGSSIAWSSCCVAMVVGYLIAIAPSWARGIRIGLLAGVFGLGIVVLAPSTSVAVLACMVLLGLMRSGFLLRTKPARALVTETGLLAAGLAMAYVLAGWGVLSIALAIWGFFLVQSLYFLVGGIGQRAGRAEDVDPFEKAHKQAVRLMDDYAV